jgi:hypothetical protein
MISKSYRYRGLRLLVNSQTTPDRHLVTIRICPHSPVFDWA